MARDSQILGHRVQHECPTAPHQVQVQAAEEARESRVCQTPAGRTQLLLHLQGQPHVPSFDILPPDPRAAATGGGLADLENAQGERVEVVGTVSPLPFSGKSHTA